ncbi:alpha-galactosidase [Cellulomonas soli]|uniref:Alpha-galactosidase n=1 Tax=Cellulomonas soli TaxID=931535 RepID=A0A512PDT0_9CELL|nr:alpha-galactosidase [Cellulomonas soli]NYI60064.1 alpha-galactosidase [Cellulomonas soli]GEP69282.1 alpha-galactosidase [Cellulomonas soli]
MQRGFLPGDVHGRTYHHLRAAGVSVVVVTSAERMPHLVHWGADLGDLGEDALAALDVAAVPPLTHNTYEVSRDATLVPAFHAGWLGRPGVLGSRRGRDWSPLFTDVQHVREDADRAQRIVSGAVDPVAGLALRHELELDASGLLRLRVALTNTADEEYEVSALRVALPVPAQADELLDFTGRHTVERVPQRQPFTMGLHAREVRQGRPGLDSPYLMIAGRQGFAFRSGQVWGVHLGFSGNQDLYAERIPNGARVLGAGELLQPGEIVLGAGESYESPWVYASYGEGLDQLAGRFHTYLRARPQHPRSPRPVLVNTWEATYFDHDLARLTALADAAAEAGVERFVLDDGWFGSRRDDTSGLGDWQVSPEAWPDGLGPLVDHVRGRGMQFGIWVEPEMVNLDSDLARAHPEWVFTTGGRLASPARFQHGLDLTHPEAWDHILSALDDLLSAYDIGYVKWDHNRTLVEAGHHPDGRPAIHAQTLAVYAMLDELRRRHPGVEFESCASGGGRVDLGILERTDRVWASDCNDALERVEIQRWTQLLLPPELIGAHIGPSPAHTTGRRHGMQLRAGTAVFGHLGIESDLTALSDEETDEVAAWVAFYRAHRDLLHSGTVVNVDHPDPAVVAHGVVSTDRDQAVFAVTMVRRSVTWPPGPLTLPGLDPDTTYTLTLVTPGDGDETRPLPLWASDGVALTGRQLEQVGLQMLPLLPERLFLLRADALR